MKPFIFLLVGLFVGYTMSIIFKTEAHKPVPIVAHNATTPIKNTVAMTGVYYQGVVDSLQQNNAVLVSKVSNTRTELQQVKAHNKMLVDLVDTLMANSAQTTDTIQKLADCDSLGILVQDVLYTSAVKDSLYDSILTLQHQEMMNKDQIIQANELKYDGLKFSFDQTIAQQDLLLDSNILLDKQLKHSRTKNKILSAVVVVLAGLTTVIALHH